MCVAPLIFQISFKTPHPLLKGKHPSIFLIGKVALLFLSGKFDKLNLTYLDNVGRYAGMYLGKEPSLDVGVKIDNCILIKVFRLLDGNGAEIISGITKKLSLRLKVYLVEHLEITSFNFGDFFP